MIAEIPPGLLLILGAIPVPFIAGKARSIYILALPIFGIFQLTALDPGTFGVMSPWDMNKSTHAWIN